VSLPVPSLTRSSVSVRSIVWVCIPHIVPEQVTPESAECGTVDK
jgi:hypothetical protein